MVKKLISFSIWGDKPLYLDGAVRCAQSSKDFYPDYTCRFYHDNTVPGEYLMKFVDAGAEIRLMPRSIDVLGMYWRFRPMFEDNENIERFLVRDTDCAFTRREVDAVREWESNGKPFHIIRDNRVHNIPILGGTWGAIPGCIQGFQIAMESWLSHVQPMPSQHEGRLYHGTDQLFLGWYVWPRVFMNHTAHIRSGENNLKFTGEEIELPPLEENGHYVGQVA